MYQSRGMAANRYSLLFGNLVRGPGHSRRGGGAESELFKEDDHHRNHLYSAGSKCNGFQSVLFLVYLGFLCRDGEREGKGNSEKGRDREYYMQDYLFGSFYKESDLCGNGEGTGGSGECGDQ